MKDKIAVFSAVLLGIVVGFFATLSLIIDAFVVDNLAGTLIDLLIMGFSYMTAWIGVRYILTEKISRNKVDKEWNYKVKPIMNLLTDTIGRMNMMESEVIRTNRKIDTTLDYVTKMHNMDASSVYILPGITFKFLTKVFILIAFIICALVYTNKSSSLGIIYYFILFIYLLWWVLLTSEYHLFNNKMAWIWALIPIMTVPLLGGILDATLGINITIGTLFFFMFIYVYSYYSWGVYATIGFKIFDNNKIKGYLINNVDTYFQQEKVEHKINRKWIDAGILTCIAIAGAIAIWIFV